jgi:CubicO group peptidase (beta-lactamase class C family)
VTLSFLLLAVFAQEPVAATLDEAFARAAEAVRAAALPGSPAIGLALRAGGEERAYAWGWADVNDEVAATPDTRFRLGSVSKCLTGIAAVLLWQRGALDFDTPVQTYLPDFPVKEAGAITPRLLAAHLSGIPHYGPGDRFDFGNYHAVHDGLAIFAAQPLRHAPGERFAYSTYGFNLLGACVEGAAQQEFRAFVRDAVCAPLGMPNTLAEHPGADLGAVAALYETAFGVRAEVPRDDISYKWPGGGYVAAPRDLVRLAQGLEAGNPLLEPRALELLRTPQCTAAGDNIHYSYGFYVHRDGAGRLRMSHSGSQTGCKAFFLCYPDQRVAVAVFANHGDSNVGSGDAAKAAAAILLEALTACAAAPLSDKPSAH